MKLRYIIIACAILINGKLRAQNIGLNIGASLPTFNVGKLINSDKRSLSTSEFKEQLLIIDFWATNCSGCVVALPKMDALQRHFGNKITILPVTYEAEGHVRAFWKKNSYTKALSLPSVVEDKVFASYFKHRTIPHEIWIYKGKVIGVTGSDFVDSSNIERILSGARVDWPVKNDFYNFDGDIQPLFNLDPNQINIENTPIKYAAIGDYKDGVNAEGASGGAGIVRDKNKKTVRTYFLNQPIFDSYKIILQQLQLQNPVFLNKPSKVMVGPNEVIWEVADRSKYTFNLDSKYLQEWIRQHAICFESLNPDTGQTDSEVKRTIIKDLDRLLGLKVRWEKREERILVLTWSSNLHRIPEVYSTSDLSLSSLIYQLNQQETNPYVFDDTGYKGKGKVSVKIRDWSDLTEVRRAIRVYGLELQEKYMEVDKLVFSEVDGGLLVDGRMIAEMVSKRNNQINLGNPSEDMNGSFIKRNQNNKGVITLPSGLQYKIIRVGKGSKPTLNDKVVVNYTASLVNGRIFNSSNETGRPAVFQVNDVIKGWAEALQLMPVGSRWIVYIPAELGYGAGTATGTIPPNSTLVFELELLQIKK